ncbi:gephyrin-like molybdotransferase Glp [Oerskovia enterophila]|uniref:Molybdopterin molybdenumtransferase n=1 Tax=Oerskovia enterophila TaxID=43678 RepID=A0A163PVS4_9CELL|nr:gephyrin-like molybdotransferase Glp [Oerskovia enterophila]KZM33554.1 molybdopterin molybdenumtransferase [Oerskovia enterophila]
MDPRASDELSEAHRAPDRPRSDDTARPGGDPPAGSTSRPEGCSLTDHAAAGRVHSVEEYRDHVLTLVAPLAAEQVALDALATGTPARRVLAHDVRSLLDVPRFDASAMDGYAVRSADLATASAASPVTLRVVGDIAAAPTATVPTPGPPAGQSPTPPTGAPLTDAPSPATPADAPPTTRPTHAPGEATRIMTGAPVPDWCDAVVPVERTSTRRFTPGAPLDPTIQVDAPSRANIRRRAEDVAIGDLVAAAGAPTTARLVSAAASAGHATLPVHRVPRVAVLSTGSELVPVGTAPGPGQIPDSNSLLLAACVRDAGGVPVRVGAVPDTAEALRAVLDDVAPHVDLIVTSGGVSAGAFDVVKEVLSGTQDAALPPAQGPSEVLLVAVGMQPGKPQAAARWRGTPMLGLPGNPVSAYVSFRAFVRPAVRRLAGHPDPAEPLVERIAEEGWRSPAGRQQFLPVRFVGDDGVAPVGPGAHHVSALTRADAIAVVPPEVEAVGPGDTVRVMVIA